MFALMYVASWFTCVLKAGRASKNTTDSVPCVFIGNPEMEELIVYGFYKDFKATISFPTVSKCTLRVEGLV